MTLLLCSTCELLAVLVTSQIFGETNKSSISCIGSTLCQLAAAARAAVLLLLLVLQSLPVLTATACYYVVRYTAAPARSLH
jgi:hypothetical protein